jgi:cephalosporin-C deacetylase
MNRIRFISFFSLFLSWISVVTHSQGINLKQTNESGIYKKGQNISVVAYTEKLPGDSIHIRIFKNNRQILVNKVLSISNDSLIVFEGSFKDPCSIIVEAKMNKESSTIGMLIDPEKLKPGNKTPKDFHSYWDLQKEILKALPLEVKTTPLADSEIVKGFICENIEINCPGPNPARGYLAKPQNATSKSLPIVLLVHAAGVKGSWCRSEPKNALNYAKMGALCFDLNAHGMLNGQPESYYAGLETGELRNYYLKGVTNKNEFYFRGMYLRLLRTIDFLTRQQEWDGKRILVIGESQGGGQALIAAGLDKRVSAVIAIVPAMCDWMGPVAGRMGGWPQPLETDNSKEEMLKAIPYYDAVNILKGSKATIFTEIGLIDMTCPATSVYTAVNQSKGKKIIYAVPYRPHHQPQNAMSKIWEETVYKPRELFIKDYLK